MHTELSCTCRKDRLGVREDDDVLCFQSAGVLGIILKTYNVRCVAMILDNNLYSDVTVQCAPSTFVK